MSVCIASVYLYFHPSLPFCPGWPSVNRSAPSCLRIPMTLHPQLDRQSTIRSDGAVKALYSDPATWTLSISFLWSSSSCGYVILMLPRVATSTWRGFYMWHRRAIRQLELPRDGFQLGVDCAFSTGDWGMYDFTCGKPRTSRIVPWFVFVIIHQKRSTKALQI